MQPSISGLSPAVGLLDLLVSFQLLRRNACCYLQMILLDLRPLHSGFRHFGLVLSRVSFSRWIQYYPYCLGLYGTFSAFRPFFQSSIWFIPSDFCYLRELFCWTQANLQQAAWNLNRTISSNNAATIDQGNHRYSSIEHQRNSLNKSREDKEGGADTNY